MRFPSKIENKYLKFKHNFYLLVCELIFFTEIERRKIFTREQMVKDALG